MSGEFFDSLDPHDNTESGQVVDEKRTIKMNFGEREREAKEKVDGKGSEELKEIGEPSISHLAD